jgi:phage-related protein
VIIYERLDEYLDDWKLVQYNNVVDSFLDKHNIDLDNTDEKKLGNLKPRLGTLLELGHECTDPPSKYLENGLFELKAKEDKKEIRLIYFFRSPPYYRTICFVHAFIKKTQKTSSKDKGIAKKNKNIVENEGGKPDDFNITN